MRKGYHRAMGKRNYLIEGVSGARKTAVCTELQRRGYPAIHGDQELVYRGDPETELPTAPETGTPTATWMSEHWIWDVEKVQAFVANQEEAVTFFCGGSRNFAKFIDLFDGVFVLEVDLDTMNRRIDERVALDPTDFGGKPEERELAVRLHQTKTFRKTASSSAPPHHSRASLTRSSVKATQINHCSALFTRRVPGIAGGRDERSRADHRRRRRKKTGACGLQVALAEFVALVGEPQIALEPPRQPRRSRCADHLRALTAQLDALLRRRCQTRCYKRARDQPQHRQGD